jgi:hypothetical protein
MLSLTEAFMPARTLRVDVTIFAGALALGAVLLGPQAAARADGSPPAAPPVRAAAPRAAAIKHAPPPARARDADASSLYGCSPGQDLACTVIHETAQGIVVVTFRPTNVKNAPNWSVVNAPAETNAGSSGGTIYIVPGSSRQLSAVTLSTNGAPIID